MTLNPKNPFALIILDGWGIQKPSDENFIFKAKTPTIDFFVKHYFAQTLNASGEAVGLSAKEPGNSAAGHLTIGAGRIVYNNIGRVNRAISSREFARNRSFLRAIDHAKNTNSKIHIIGVPSKTSRHGRVEHVSALLGLIKAQKFANKVYVHFFPSPKEPMEDQRKEVKEMLDENKSQENIKVGLVTQKSAGFIKQGDVVIFAITSKEGMLFAKDYADKSASDGFPKDAHIVKFMDSLKFSADVAFPDETIKNCMGKVISELGYTQMKIAETEKFAHATFFLDGASKSPFRNERWVLVPSAKCESYAEIPEMSAREITQRVLRQLQSMQCEFLVINFANTDSVGHTHNGRAIIRAAETVDSCVRGISHLVLKMGGIVMITSDHGNAEDNKKGHTINPVPCIIAGEKFFIKKENRMLFDLQPQGGLSDIAPTILDILNLPIPQTMTGSSLL